MKSKLIVFPLLFLLYSCKYTLLVDTRNVVKDVRGYLVFREGSEVTFYPFNDTIDVHFLADKHKKEGYRIEYDTYWMDSLSIDYSHLIGVEAGMPKLSILPVEIRYYLGSAWQKEDEENTIHYKWNNEPRVLRFKQHDWRNIIHIILLRKSDKERVDRLNIDWGPPHYRQFRSEWNYFPPTR